MKKVFSDGEVEDEILKWVQSGKETKEILSSDNRWPVLYHFSPERRNLLEWYPFEKEASILEIGAGCGALTGLFCEKVKKVTAIELTKRRARIIKTRHSKQSNLRVLSGNYLDMIFSNKADYAVLVGVLEYARRFISGRDPHCILLEKVYSDLKEKGKLIIAIENRFGLKYFAGAPEDHTGKVFDSIEDYPSEKIADTFGRYELEDMLRKNRFRNVLFYYPFPDYKLPQTIYSDSFLPEEGTILNSGTPKDRSRYIFFSEQTAFHLINRNNLFPIFSNSYLIIAEK